MPYLLDTKIKVKFDGIKINTERQLFEGKLVTTYDVSEKNLKFLQEGIGEVFGDAGAKTNKIDFEIAEIKKDENGRIVVIGKPDAKTGITPQVVLPAGSDYQLADSQGKVWTLDEQGEVTSVGEKADTKLAQNQGKNNLPKGQSPSENFEVKWDFSQSVFAFDTSGEIPYKALVKGKNDVFQVVIKQKDTLRYSFHFQTDKGLKVDSNKEKEGVFELSRKGLFDFADEELWVVAKNAKTEKEEVVGKCMLVYLSEKEVNVTLVPITEGLQIDTETIKEIYAKVGVTLRISTDKVFPVTEKIDTENAFGDLSTYSPHQQEVITQYKSERALKSDVYYVFVGKQEGSQAGYMRLGGQFGFVMDANERTIAHELGHGIFKLEHSFKGKEDAGNPHRLMDYAGGENFTYSDWKQINDPKLKIYAFQGQDEGEIDKLVLDLISFCPNCENPNIFFEALTKIATYDGEKRGKQLIELWKTNDFSTEAFVESTMSVENHDQIIKIKGKFPEYKEGKWASIMKVIGYPNSYFFNSTITIDNKKIPYQGELKIQKKSEDMHIYGIYPPQSGIIGGTGTEVNGFYFVNVKNNVIMVLKFNSKNDMSLVWKTYYSNVRNKAIKDFILKYDKEHKTNYYESIYPQK